MLVKIFNLKNVRLKTILFLVLYALVIYIIVENYNVVLNSKNVVKNTPIMKLEYVVVHLDLKGAPPKLSYLESILPMLKNHGVNGLLIEYEDMFPYEGRLEKLRAVNFFKKKELQAYLTVAVSYGFEIIPLVQTFGHLEFALKLKEFAHLREIPEPPDTLCPSSFASRNFLHNILQQVIHFHQRIAPLKHIHVGCGEIFHYNNCSLYQKRNFTKAQALSSHINFVIDTVHLISPDATILIWDDMYRDIKPLQTINLKFSKTEAVYWDYTSNLRKVAHTNMFKYNRMFDNLWTATAFKGADGCSQILPNLRARFHNHLLWLHFIFNFSTMKNLYRIKGIILTGLSRYKHDDSMCELFPASIHSLILNLILIEQYRKGIVVHDLLNVKDFIHQHIRGEFASSLNCQKDHDRFIEPFDAQSCHYDGSDLYVVLQNLINQTSVIKSKKEECYEYVNRIQAHMEFCSQMFHELSMIEAQLIGLLSVYFENYVIEEFIQTNIRNLKVTVTSLINIWDYKDVISSDDGL